MGNPRGRQKDKIITDAVRIALLRVATDIKEGENPKDRKKLHQLADTLVDKAISGDVAAIKEVADRIEGKPAQQVQLSGDEENPITTKEVGRVEKARRIAFYMRQAANDMDAEESDEKEQQAG